MPTARSRYEVGQTVEVYGAFVDEDGGAADPTAVTISVKPPTGDIVEQTLAAAEVTRRALGDFYALFDADQAGTWSWRTEGVLDGKTAVDEGTFVVRESVFE